MTETDWLTSSDPTPMLEALTVGLGDVFPDTNFRPSDRKLRLFACACCRQVWDQITDPRSRRAVEVAERYADGQATKEELARASVAAFDATDGMNTAWVCCNQDPFAPALQRIVYAETEPVIAPATQAALLRCVFGNPWRPVELPGPPCPDCAPGEPDENCDDCGGDGTVDGPCPWLTPTVLAIARSVYDERRPADLPILADALLEAECPEEVACPACEGDGHARTAVSTLLHSPCPRCGRTGRVPNPLLAHLRQVDGPCWHCIGTGWVSVQVLQDSRDPGAFAKTACPACGGTGRVPVPAPAPHALPGCWALDLILGKE